MKSNRQKFSNDNMAVYIHWPFCKSKCPYCDFNSHVAESIDHEEWLECYKKELKYYREKLGGRSITSVFFGGGTPSLMKPNTVSQVLQTIDDLWGVPKDTEITLEANPTSVEVDGLKAMKAAGVNRVSLGIQSFDDKQLKFLGREHSSKEAISAIENVQKLFDNYSFDIIYALPNQTIADLKKEMTMHAKLVDKHTSLYQLTIEKGTPFHKAYREGEFLLPNEDLAVEMYQLVGDVLSKNKINQYEISNYSKKGFECKHNLSYWNYDEFVGIGPGAHSRIKSISGREGRVNIHRPDKWLESVRLKEVGLQSSEPVEGQYVMEEFMLMGLRLNDGVGREKFFILFGADFEDVLNYKKLLKNNLIEIDNKGMRATDKGRLLLNNVVTELFS